MNSDLPGLSERLTKELAVAALQDAAIKAQDAEFLRSEIGFSRFVTPSEFEPSAKLDIASRLLNLGLSARALDYLPERPVGPEQVAVSARILVANSEAEKALEISQVLSQTDDLFARAEALDHLGRRREAARIYAEVGADEVASMRALQAGDLDWLSSERSTKLAEAVAVLKVPGAEVSATSTLTSLADHAESRRRAALEVLNSTRVKEVDEIH